MTDQTTQPFSAPVDREQLILDHLPLLHHIAGRMVIDMPGSVERDDLVGYGMLGLIGAADAWDPSRGLKFSTYAFPKIRGAILDELRRQDLLPRGARERVRDLDRTIQRLEQETGMPPTPETIAEELGIAIEDVDEIMLSARAAVHASIDQGPSEDFANLLANPRSEDPVGSAEWEESKVLLARAIEELPEQEKSVITLYYADNLLLREIGEIMGITESRVSQVHSRALYRLNRGLKSLHHSS